MIFADKLIELRKKNGWSQEKLAEELNVSRQTVSKWEGAQSVPDFNRVIQISELFGVTTDYLLKDSIENSENIEGKPVYEEITLDNSNENIHPVSMEEANSFLQARDNSSGKTALGVMMCILSPVILIATSGLQENNLIKISENQAAGLGLIILILMITGAVAIFIRQYLMLKPYEYLEHENIETAYGINGMVKERCEKYKPVYIRLLTIGISLCVCSPIPIFISLLFFGDSDLFSIFAVCILLIFVAFGVMMIVKCSIIWGSFSILLETDDYSRKNKRESKRNNNIASIYWGITTALYLGYSFITMRWGISWVIWPVAGILYGVLCAILRMLRKEI